MKKNFAPCVMNCPANVDIPGFINLIKKNQFDLALQLIMEKLPLPQTVAKICPHPCKLNCARRFKDTAINIPELRIFLAQMLADEGKIFDPQPKNEIDKKIGIIGGGPAGICAAYFLRQFGYQITIYDAMPKMGGMLRYGIPEYRLPKKILDREISFLSRMHINLINNFEVDRQRYSQMKEEFNAIIICIGAWNSAKIVCEGSNFFIDGVKFLRDMVLGEKNFVSGKKIAVIGGGNTAMDICRSAVRLGADSVINIYRRTKNEMPAQVCEINDAQNEGVIFKQLLSPVKIIDNGKDKTLVMQKYKLAQKDSDGRNSVVAENEFVHENFDYVISAISQKVKSDFFDGKLNEDGTIKINDFFQTDNPKVFAIGDAIHASKDRIAAVAISDAKKVSDMVNNFLMGLPMENDQCQTKNMYTKQNANANALQNKTLLTEDEFLQEAWRCLNCGGCKK